VEISRPREGCAVPPANDNAVMDVAGAKELARVLAERRRVAPAPPGNPEPPPEATRDDTNVAPLFRWLGIEPPATNAPAEPSE
jgi:hypothetical protein